MFCGALLARSAGCIINDYWDRRIDKEVERTANRPLASGEVSIKEAAALVTITGLGAIALLCMLPKASLMAGLLAIPLILLYPLVKKVSFYPQVVLGLTFNIGVFIGWYAVSKHLSFTGVALYAASVLWTIGYDSIYGLQDIVDDKKIGVKSLSLKMGDNTPKIAWHSYKTMMAMIALVGLATGLNFFFYLVLVIATYYLYWQTETLQPDDRLNCHERFVSNVHIGALIWLAILIGRI
jgi:4-hydroxybenzoate polyprenyl transferase